MKSAKLSVVQIIDRLHIGGAERVLITIANLLYKKGHKVKVIVIVEKGPLANQLHPEIELICLNRKQKFNPFTMYQLVKEIEGFDIVHVHSSFNLRYTFLSIKLFFVKRRLFYHEHFGDIDIDQTVHWHQRYIYPKTIMIAVSRSIFLWASQQLNMPSKKLFLLPNSIEKEMVEKPVEQKFFLINLLQISNIRPTKNIQFSIELMAFLIQHFTCRLTIVGQIADEIYYEEIKALIQRSGLENHIIFIHDCTNPQLLMHQFTAAIHTAKSESGPLVLIEYLAQQLPFLTYNTGEVVAQIQQDLPECIMHDFDKEKWMKQLLYLLDHPFSIKQKMNKLYEQFYSEDAYYNACIAIYEKGLTLS